MLWVLNPSLLSLRLFSYPVLLLFSGEDDNDGAKKNKPVIMERVGGYSSGGKKSTPALPLCSVLKTATTQECGSSCILSLVAECVSRLKNQ